MLGGSGGFHYLWFYSIWFLGQDISWDNILSPALVAIFTYINLPVFFFSNWGILYFIYVRIFMFILMKLITCNEFNKVKVKLIEYGIIMIDRIEKLTCLNPWLERLHVEKCSKNNNAICSLLASKLSMTHPCLLSDVYVVVILQPQIVERYFSECSDSVKLVNVTLRSALLLVRVSILWLKINFSYLF